MIELPYAADLFDVDSNQVVSANVVVLDRDMIKHGIVAAWWQLPGTTGTQRRQEPDHKWPWIEVIGRERKAYGSAYQSIGIQTADGEVQGAITYWINKQSHLEPKKGAIEVDRLAVAPRNRPSLRQPPCFKGVGAVLLRHAIWHSYRLGFCGRIRLESVDSRQAHNFYRKHGMEVIMEDEGYLEFELPAEAAETILRYEGFLP